MIKYTSSIENVRNMKVFKHLRIIICLLLIPNSIFSMAGKDHVSEQMEILGLSKAEHRDTLTKVSRLIDNTDTIFYQLNKDYGFNMGRGEHRLLFHWGFSVDPRKSDALKKRLDQKRIVGEEREDFYKDLIKEQQRRNSEIIKLTMSIFKFRTLSSNMASIIYDIHILQDYTTSSTSGLMDEGKLFDDISRNLTKVFNKKYVISDFYDLRNSLNECSYKNDTKGYREVLKKKLPRLITKRFGKL